MYTHSLTHSVHALRYDDLPQLAAGLCCGLSCLAAGGTIGILGDAGVRAFGIKAENGRKWYWGAGGGDGDGDDEGVAGAMESNKSSAESANKLYVGMLIMLIFSEALALYGLIVALILSQHSYSCE
jgi:V-type H+-transporting ATPase proteolipid subunit